MCDSIEHLVEQQLPSQASEHGKNTTEAVSLKELSRGLELLLC